MLVAASAPVDWLPLVVLLPVHAPLAVHELALVLDQLSVLLPPELMLAGVAVKLTVGSGATAVTVMAAVCDAVPPLPLHVSV